MVVDPTEIKFYRCSSWTKGNAHGGDISETEIISGELRNIFNDVTNSERILGVFAFDPDAYRKIFIKNLNIDTWESVKLWISQFTLATNDEISISLGTPTDVVSEIKENGSSPLTFVSPDSKLHEDVLTIGNLSQDEYVAIWILRTVVANGGAYTSNSFKLSFESS